MAEAETSDARIAYTKETGSYGVNPGTGAKYLRITSESLKEEQQRTSSEEVTGDRNPRENIRTGENAAGGVNFELSPNNFDDMFEGAAMATLPAAPALISSSIQAIASSQTFVAASGLAGVLKGQWFRTAGFTSPLNNGIFRAAADSTATIITAETGSGLVDEASAAGRKIQFSQLLRPGSTRKSFTLERQWTDINVFEPFPGMVIESLDLTIAKEAKITGAIKFMGKGGAAASVTTTMGTIAAAGIEHIDAAIDTLRNVRQGSFVTDTTFRTTDISFSLSNKTRMKKDAASLTPFDVGLGVIECTGKWKVFLASKTLIDTFRNNANTSLSFRIIGLTALLPDYVFTFPQIRITDLNDPITGNSDDGFLDLSWTAETDANAVAIQIDKLPIIP